MTNSRPLVFLMLAVCAAGCRSFAPGSAAESNVVVLRGGVPAEYRSLATPAVLDLPGRGPSPLVFVNHDPQLAYDVTVWFPPEVSAGRDAPPTEQRSHLRWSSTETGCQENASKPEALEDFCYYELICLEEGCLLTVGLPRALSRAEPARVEIDPWWYQGLERGYLSFGVHSTTVAQPRDDQWTRQAEGYVVLRPLDRARPALTVALDDTGIASPRLLNPRKPAFVLERPLTTGLTRNRQEQETRDRVAQESDANLRRTLVRFQNLTIDRTLLVDFPIVTTVGTDCESARLARVDALFPGSVIGVDGEARKKAAEKPFSGIVFTCPANGEQHGFQRIDVRLQIGPTEHLDLPALIFERPTGRNLDLVQLTVDFFEQIESPTNSRGYLSLYPLDIAKASSWEPPKEPFDPKATARFGFSKGLLTSTTCAGDRSTTECVWGGDTHSRFPAAAALELDERLGLRADTKVVFAYQKGDLGDQAGDEARAEQFWAQVFGSNGVSLRAGKFSFLTPAEKIAIAEVGEGLQVRGNAGQGDSSLPLSLGYLVRRESTSGKADDDDRDHDVLMLEIGPWTPRVRFLRRLTLYALYGDERATVAYEKDQATGKITAAVTPHRYTTYGGEAFFGFSRFFHGSVAAYGSERNSQGFDPADPFSLRDGRGRVGLLQLHAPVRWRAGGRKPAATLSLRVGTGTGDDPGTATLDESYIGESAAFTADSSLFFTELAGRLALPPESGVTGDPKRLLLPGLADKVYVGLQVSRTGFNFLSLVAQFLNFTDPSTETMVVRLHHVERQRGDGLPHSLGNEFQFDFNLSAPAGVKWNLGGSYFEPDRGLESLVSDSPWRLALGVSFEL